MRTKPPAVRHFLYVDPRTGARRVLTKIDPRAPDCAPPLAEMVQSFSLPARIAELRKEADALPDAYPEKAEMLYRLELASKLTGDSRLLRVSRSGDGTCKCAVGPGRRLSKETSWRARPRRTTGGRSAAPLRAISFRLSSRTRRGQKIGNGARGDASRDGGKKRQATEPAKDAGMAKKVERQLTEDSRTLN